MRMQTRYTRQDRRASELATCWMAAVDVRR